jgi:hypothetical protein
MRAIVREPRPTKKMDRQILTSHPFDAPWLELVESFQLACIELAEMLRAGLSLPLSPYFLFLLFPFFIQAAQLGG